MDIIESYLSPLYPEFTPIKTRMVDGVFIVSTRNLNLLFLNETVKSFCGYADGTNSFAQIIDLLLKEYDVPRETLVSDMENLLRELQWEQLITLSKHEKPKSKIMKKIWEFAKNEL